MLAFKKIGFVFFLFFWQHGIILNLLCLSLEDLTVCMLMRISQIASEEKAFAGNEVYELTIARFQYETGFLIASNANKASSVLPSTASNVANAIRASSS